MLSFLHHLLLPRESNNHKAKLLHHSGLLFVILFLLVGDLFFNVIHTRYPSVLGINATISSDELLTLTNQKRQERGLAPLTHNPELAYAASLKAQDMFGKNYWAHNSPDGGTPWGFIKGAGYEYFYAGENLARGFTTANDVVNAWMESPGHRENILSPNYKEIGFAVSPGTLTGEETVLVVQMFGSRNTALATTQTEQATPVITVAPTSPVVPTATILPSPTIAILPTQSIEQPGITPLVASIQNPPLINQKSLGRSIVFTILGLFLVVFALDLIIIKRRNIIRFATHHIDHMIFLVIILLIVIMIGKGAIL